MYYLLFGQTNLMDFLTQGSSYAQNFQKKKKKMERQYEEAHICYDNGYGVDKTPSAMHEQRGLV